MKISIIIPTHGRPNLIKRTLISLSECKIPPSFCELVVVENGSRKGIERIIDGLPEKLNARYMYVPTANKSNALNVALENIDDHQLVFFTDDDAQFHPNILYSYVEAASEHGRGHFFGGPVKVVREKDPPEWMEPLLPYAARGYDLVTTRMRNIYLGINWAAFSSDIKELGGFNIQFGPGSPIGATGQETDMEERMLKSGMTGVDVLDAVVWHYVPESRCNIEWLKSSFFKYGMSRGIKSPNLKSSVKALFNVGKYSVRWMVYLLMLNKMERARSRMELITQFGFFYALVKRLSMNNN